MHVVTIMRGPTLKTLAEARAYILKLPKAKQSSHWDMAIRCLLQAAEKGQRRGHHGGHPRDRAGLSVPGPIAHSAQATGNVSVRIRHR
jgi:hypothetical protein